MEQLDEAWRAKIPTMQEQLHSRWRLFRAFEHEDGLALERRIQARLVDAWKLHGCCHKGDVFDDSMLQPAVHPDQPAEVDVVFLGCARGRVSVPSWSCSSCCCMFRADPIDAHCFPATPCAASLWLHRPLLELYRQLGLHDGVSMTGMLS